MEDLRRMREEAGLTQAGLARTSGVDRATINKIEQGKRSPSIETLEKLARAMGTEVGDFFPKAQASLPFEEPQNEEASTERRYLSLLMDSYAEYFSDRIRRNGPRIANLPEDLLPSDSLRVYQWVAEFMADCDILEDRLNQEGVFDAVIALVDRANDGAYVPAELLRKARRFQQTSDDLFVGVWTVANNWVNSQLRRPDVLEFSNAERLARKADSASVIPLQSFRQRKEKKISPGAEATG